MKTSVVIFHPGDVNSACMCFSSNRKYPNNSTNECMFSLSEIVMVLRHSHYVGFEVVLFSYHFTTQNTMRDSENLNMKQFLQLNILFSDHSELPVSIYE